MNYEGGSTPMDPNSPRSELMYHDDMVYEGWIDSWFILMQKGVLVIMQGCTNDSKQVLWIGLID